MIPVYKPYLPPQSLKYAHEALDSTWISSQGKFLNMATEKLQELLNVPHVILLNNGTSACHLVAKSLAKMRHNPYSSRKKDLVAPNNVYVAAWNSFLFDQDYHITPLDANVDTWNIDLQLLDRYIASQQPATIDILVVHNVGNIVNVPELQRRYPNSYIVEDNCEGFLGTYEGRATGTAGLASAISFFGNKNITSGEGGAFITSSEELYQYAKCVQGQGQSSKRFVHDELGHNYRMTNIQAAILLGQLEILPDILSMKNDVFTTYRNGFRDHEKIRFQLIDENTTNANWMFGVRVIGHTNYEEAEVFFKNAGVEIRPMFYPVTAHKHLKESSNITTFFDCANGNLLNKECFILPSYPELTKSEQDYIIKTVHDYVKGM
jgi:perosamine synthetase